MNKTNKTKYKNAILYFSYGLKDNVIDAFKPDKIKIAKLLYYLDFINFRDRKKSITGTVYYKQSLGPLPKDYEEMIGELVSEGKLVASEKVIVTKGDTRVKTDVLLAKESPEMDKVFREEEQILARKILNQYKEWTAEELSAKSHLESPWIKAEYGAVLDFELADDIDDFDETKEQEYKEEDLAIIGAIQEISGT